MNYIKNFLWVVILALLYASGALAVGGISPELLLIFSICYGVSKPDFSQSIIMSLVCGLIMSALGGRGFVFSILVCLYSVLFFRALILRYPKSIKIMPLIFLAETIIYEVIFYLMISTVSANPMKIVLFASLYNFAVMCIIRPLVTLSYKEKERYIFNP